MIHNFNFASPTKFIFGHGAQLNTADELQAKGATRVFVHYGQSSVKESGLLDQVLGLLQNAGIEYTTCGGVRANPEIELVREGIDIAREFQTDYILAIGGGSVIDSSKAISAGYYYDGDVWDAFNGNATIADFLPIACILTIPAAGSEGSKNTVISNDEVGAKVGYANEKLRPELAFMNPELMYTLSRTQLATGMVDMFSHSLERFFGSSEDFEITDNIALSLMKTIYTQALKLMENPQDYDACANIMWAGMLSHNGIAGCGRREEWTTHALEHELSALDPNVAHGAGLAVLFPAWMHFVHTQAPARFAKFGREVFGIEDSGDDLRDARTAIRKTAEFFADLDMPMSIEELGLEFDEVKTVIPKLRINKGDTIGSIKVLSDEDILAIYALASSS